MIKCVFSCPNNFIKSNKFSINCVCSKNHCRWVKNDMTSDFSSGWADVHHLYCYSQQAAPVAHYYQYSETCDKLPPLEDNINASWLCKKKTCLLSCPKGWRKNRLIKISCFCQNETAFTAEQCDYKLLSMKTHSYSAIQSKYWLNGLNFKCVQRNI